MAAEDNLIEAASTELSRHSAGSDIDGFLQRLASAGLSQISQRRVIDEVRRRTKIPLSALQTQLASYKRDLRPAAPSWTSKIVLAPSGEPCPIASNVLIALEHAPEWEGVLAYDEFHQRPTFLNKPPWRNGDWRGPTPFVDVDESRVLVWMQEAGIHCRIEAVRQALAIATDNNRFHPVRDYLDSLAWDGVPRLGKWLTYYLGVEPIKDYTGPIGSRWMISAVARIYEPGCLAKYCLVLEGPQDLGKSTALEALGSPWFTDDVAELGTKDSQMQVGNAWIVELSELDSVRKAHVSAIKSFISRKTDQFRKPFGRYITQQPRQCVLAGTVNPAGEYLADDTGAVRFWPVFCTSIDIEALRADKDQLWAEAVHRYRAKEPWWLDVSEMIGAAADQQDNRFNADAWEEPIARWLRTLMAQQVTTMDVLVSALDVPVKDHDRSKQTRVGIILSKRLGWTSIPTNVNGKTTRIYHRPG